MAIFLTKVWGFTEPSGPLSFSEEGWRASARATLSDGDFVVLVGTKGHQTAEEDRGRLLGMMEPTREIVSVLDYDLRTRPIDFNEDRGYRWPSGLLTCNAWKFPGRPLLEQVSRRSFYMDSALGIVSLNEEEAAKILSLEREQVELLLPVRARARIEGEEAARRRGAPPPSTTRRGVMHLRRAPAYTYAMTIEGARGAAFKIGWAFDFRARERHFNSAALPYLGGLRYQTCLHHLWDTALDAFKMEQALLRRFDHLRHSSNREIVTGVSLNLLQSAWADQLMGMRRR